MNRGDVFLDEHNEVLIFFDEKDGSFVFAVGYISGRLKNLTSEEVKKLRAIFPADPQKRAYVALWNAMGTWYGFRFVLPLEVGRNRSMNTAYAAKRWMERRVSYDQPMLVYLEEVFEKMPKDNIEKAIYPTRLDSVMWLEYI